MIGFTGCSVNLINLNAFDIKEEGQIFTINSASVKIVNTKFLKIYNINNELFLFNLVSSNLLINLT